MISIGADVAQEKIDICIYDHDKRTVLKETVISNDEAGFRNLQYKVYDFNPTHLLVESTGGLEILFCAHFKNKIENILILNPKQVKKFKEALFEDQKTDRIDARVLAEMASLHRLQGKKPVGGIEKILHELLRQRHFLVMERTKLIQRKSRLGKQGVHELVQEQNTALLKVMDQKIVEVEEAILEILKQDTTLKRNFEKLQQVPGIGQKTAFVLMEYLGADASKFSSAEKFCAFAGLYPTKRESGVMKGSEKLTHKGCRTLRSMLFLAAMTTMIGKRKSPWKRYYQFKKNQGKKSKQIIVAIANKMARLAWTLIAKNFTYDESKLLPKFA